MSSRFVAGKSVEEALNAAAAVNRQGISVSLDSLGENVHSPEEARRQPRCIIGCSTPSTCASWMPM